MKEVIMLMRRHMALFFKDKTALFFSFMAVFVVLFLYVCFLGDMMITPLKESFVHTAREISDTWIMAGTLGIVSLTTTLSVLGIVINDRSSQIVDDFHITPVSAWKISLSYILSTLVITFFISLVTLSIAEGYICYYGGHLLFFSTFVKVLGVMILSIFSCSSMLYFFMSFFQSATSFSNVTTIIGTLSGFFMGIYVPIGSLPIFLQKIIMWFPPSHGAALFRQVMMEDVLNRSFSTQTQSARSIFEEQFGLTFQYGDFVADSGFHIMVLAVFTLLFLFLVWLRRRKHGGKAKGKNAFSYKKR